MSNALTPTPEQLQAFLASDFSGPVSMLNLLKFKPKARYKDGHDTDLTGIEAYQLYGQQMATFVEANGGKLVFSGRASALMIGQVESLWDMVAIMQYPSKEAFIEIVTNPKVHEFSVHRAAGLEWRGL